MNEKNYRVYVCGNINCHASGKDALLRALEQAVWEYELDALVDVRVSGCQNQCDYAPNIKVWPGPYQYSRVTPEGVRQIVAEHLRDGQPVLALLNQTIARP